MRAIVAGFPALAGMDPEDPHREPRRRGIPRARGDGPSPTCSACRRGTDSPRSRGWTHVRWPPGDRERGFPALAGMDLVNVCGGFRLRWIPRARGDGPGGVPRRRHGRPDSPRSRGWTVAPDPQGPAGRGFPALAGMDRARARAPAGRPGIPRARGDGPASGRRPCSAAPDSPRSRGWTPVLVHLQHREVGFPALAGMDPL